MNGARDMACFMALIATVALPTGSLASPAKKAPAHAATAPKPEPAVCSSLMVDYENASKKLAFNKAEDANDNSALRSANREAENNTILTQARMTMDVMKSNGCKLPPFVPSADRYSLAGLTCATAQMHIQAQRSLDRLRDTYNNYPEPSECDIGTWKPNDAAGH